MTEATPGLKRYFFVAALALLGTVALLGKISAKLGAITFPPLGLGWVAVAAAAVFILASPDNRAPLRPIRFLTMGATLAILGYGLTAWWLFQVRMASPLEVTVSARRDVSERLEKLGTLELPERRHLVRVAGRRRNFELDVRGFLRVPREGNYRFEMACDDRCRLLIGDGEVLVGAGDLSAEVRLDEGVHPLRLHYEQQGGPAHLILRWDRPALFEPFPLEAYVAGSREALERTRLRHNPNVTWAMLGAWLTWICAASFLYVRAGESRRAWMAALRKGYDRRHSDAPTSLVRPLPWLVASGIWAVLAAVTSWHAPHQLRLAREEYAFNPVRMPFVLERIEAFPAFLFSLALLCALAAVAFALVQRSAIAGISLSSAFSRRWLVSAIALSLLWGAAVSEHEWVRYGRPCYDYYCDYAELMRDVMVEPSPTTSSALYAHLLTNYHANSPVGPIAIATVGLVIPDIVTAYRLVSAAATLATLWLLLHIARRYLGLGTIAALVAGFLFTASGSVQRSLLFPQTDTVAMFFFTLALERLLALRERFTAGRYAAVLAAIALALFSKLSSLPLLGLAWAIIAWPRETLDWKGFVRGTVERTPMAVAVIGPPVALVALYVLALGTTNSYRTELVRISTLDSRFSFHLMACVVTLLPFLLASLLTLRRRWTALESLLAVCVAIYLLGLWGSGASGWERFYLNVMPIALPLAVVRFSPLPEIDRPAHVVILCTAYALAHAVRMYLHLYNGA